MRPTLTIEGCSWCMQHVQQGERRHGPYESEHVVEVYLLAMFCQQADAPVQCQNWPDGIPNHGR